MAASPPPPPPPLGSDDSFLLEALPIKCVAAEEVEETHAREPRKGAVHSLAVVRERPTSGKDVQEERQEVRISRRIR